ncbi:MAG: F0F1 ATP synthase subunit epsilon [Deltaproteobacteria bacterium]|nr:F0F1 ATP synthase subunit epsilon [Deltaproteobacteria bacterium]
MANSEHLQLDVVTPSGSALSIRVDSVQAPSVVGEFGVLPNHLPLLAALKCGLLVWEVEGKRNIAAIGPGFVEGGPDKVLLLTDLFRGAQSLRRAVRRPGIQRAAARRRLGARATRSLRRFPRRVVYGPVGALDHKKKSLAH